ncbi:Rab family GTPase [Granulosicoccus antarcticus]|uniref:GTP-binding protein n=1 Tax=Granulosicoccus antarcticus IMCC3135 TaxID=1192854 RepID=A0A2Z2P118_9GAMM|nr:Rab family GTPase [Granulosicoccus antarcticus]ASJ73997.1 hypothetical protein IMCC3135_19590 [Granulosicoccus antarcticus IMCC3135]
MITKKICLLGTVRVGKTSLVRRFVSSTFSERYLTTIGVKIDKKIVSLEQEDVQLVVWDIQGEDKYRRILISYLKGLSGYMLVIDSSRSETVETAIEVHERVKQAYPGLPYVVILSKCDLDEDPLLQDAITVLCEQACTTVSTSALTGDGVDEAFHALTSRMITLRPTG